MKRLILTLMLSAASPVVASDFQCNANGAVVTLDNGTVYYLGKSCDAARKGGGTGTWHLAASAMVVVIDGQGFRLPIEVDCDSLPACWSSG